MKGLGDLWTLFPYVRHRLLPRRLPPAVPWSTLVHDPDVGAVRLTGKLREHPGAREIVLILHGLGGSTESYYCHRAAAAVEADGASSLCLSLRGADREGEDFYNIALTADLHAAIASAALAHYERVFVLGYSMGGYVALHLAGESRDPRVKGVAAVCTPLDLHVAQRYIDSPRAAPYRWHVLGGLKSIYEAVARRRPVPTDPAEVRRVRTIYDWDRLTIVPRYGFTSPEDYYERLSVRPRLASLRIPALLVAGRHDPIVPEASIRPFLKEANGSLLEMAWIDRGGHVAFPRDLDLGFGDVTGLEPQVLQWFLRHV